MKRFRLSNRVALFAFSLALAFSFTATSAYGQATTGSVSGTVTDPKDLGVPDATVKLTNVDTGAERTTTTNKDGEFTFPRVEPGRYIVRITRDGFRTEELREVVVVLAHDTAVVAKLEVGSLTETVVVEAAAPLIESTTAQTTSTFEHKKVTDLPALGGRLDTIALLSPGVIPGFGNVNNNGATLSVNGQRSRSNNFTIDGQDNNDNTIGGPGLFLSNIDVVQEFSIVTNNFSAEYGRNQGAIVNIKTKSGTNEIHGALYGYYQTAGYDANSFDNNRDGIPKPNFNENIDGGTVGGPIKKDKAFYFFNLQSDQSKSFSTNTSGGTAFAITPAGLATLIAKCGLTNTLLAYRDHGPFAQAIGNPQALPGSIQTRNYVALATGDPCGGANFPFEVSRITRNTPTPFRQYDWGGKGDFNLSSKNTLNIRYLFQDGNSINANGSSAGYEINVPFRSQNFGATFTRQISGRQLNELRFNYGRLAVSFEGANTFKISDIGKNIARFVMPSGFLNYGLATNLPQNRLVKTFQIVDNWSFLTGRHALKIGADFRRQLTPTVFLPQVNGQFTFANISNYARNLPSRFNAAVGPLLLPIKETDIFVYFQDDFKLRPNFTLNLGIRYEYTGQPLNVVHDITVARESNPSTAFFNTSLPLSARTVPALNADRNNFAPRFGFAYTPHWGKWLFGEDKSVIRGGFSIAYDPSFFNLLLNVSTAAPTVFLYQLTGVTVPADVSGNNLRTLFAPPVGTADPRQLNQTQFDPSFRSPYAENWTLGIQRQLSSTMAFEVRYAGSRGISLYQSRNGNPFIGLPPSGTTAGTGYFEPCAGSTTTAPCFANFLPAGLTPASNGRVRSDFNLVRIRGNTASSVYHGLQSELRGRLFKQLTMGLAYTYSHNIDNVSEVFLFNIQGSVSFSQNPFNIRKAERGNSNIDLRHVLAGNFIWDIPAYKSQQGLIGHILGGWSLSGIYRWSTGRPMTPICFLCGTSAQARNVSDIGFNTTFIGVFETLRPFLSNPNAPTGSIGVFTSSSPTSLVDFNTGAPTTLSAVQFVINDRNAATIFGTPFGTGRNQFFAPHFSKADAAIFKNINRHGERVKVQIRMEARNVFNTAFLGTPDIFVDDGAPTFFNPAASATFPGISSTSEVARPRQVVFGARFIW